MEIQFGIHQDLWQEAWIAATSAVRAKKRQIDLNVQQRVQRLISDHSPGTGKALTLRVYGTMIKGFCVINNDRARVLHTDCERVVLLFAEQPYSEQGLKLPAAKRQRVDSVTLDLSRVKEAETFDWTQTPLGEDLLERLGPVERLPEPQEATGWAIGMMPAMPSLIEELPAFPEVPMEVPAEGAPPAPEGAAAAPEAADALDLFGGDLELPELPELPEAEKKRRRRLPPPGHVLGFDEKITAEVAEAQASVEPPGLESQAERLRERTEMFADHLGPLRILLGTPDKAVAYDALSAPPSESLPLPEVQPLLDDQIRPEMLGAIFARSPEGDAFLAAAAQAAEAATAAEAEAGEDPAEAAEAKAFDVQTAQIGAVIRHFVEEKDGPVMLDDLMPPSCTEKITAARTFGCLLGLATGGGLQVPMNCERLEREV